MRFYFETAMPKIKRKRRFKTTTTTNATLELSVIFEMFD